MSPVLTFCLGLLVLAGSCTAPPKLMADNLPWSVQLTTSGGFVGIGRGNLSVNSEGEFKYQEPGSSEVRKGCEGTWLKGQATWSSRQFESISDVVAKSEPAGWNKPGLDIAAPDAFGYKLELRAGSEAHTFTARWYDNTAGQLPPDLKRLSEILLQTMSLACKPPGP